jgi:glycosyltransferase involved in cell wall biosynthesis
MDDRLHLLCKALEKQMQSENITIDFIISHYWDGAKLGVLYNRGLDKSVKHIWVPHSLGAVKKRNVDRSKWENLRIDERIAIEKNIIQEVDQVAATSTIIRESLIKDYQWSTRPLFLPPCVDTERNFPHEISGEHPIWAFLASHAGLTAEEVRASLIITEVSRTDATKRKDVLIKAFAEVVKDHPESMLVVTIDQTNKELGSELLELIQSLGIEKRTAVLGSVWNELPDIYAVTDIYCTPSVMEGFGMTPQEAAATRVPIVSSQLVPFVNEYLLGEKAAEEKLVDNPTVMKVGEGAIVVPADNVHAFAAAIRKLLSNNELRQQMADKAYKITIPYFTWKNMVKVFLKESGLGKNGQGDR